MNRIIYGVLVITAMVLGLAAPDAAALTRIVDCDKGQSIQDAISRSESRADELEILVAGTCYEDVTIRRNRTIIDGNNEATIIGTVNIFAQDTRLLDITITGPGRGVLVSSGTSILGGVTLTANERVGLEIRRGSFVWLRDSMISVNGQSGVYVENASIETRNSNVLQNAGDGIWADNQSNVILRSTGIGGNEQIGLSMNLHSVLDLKGGTHVYANVQLDLFAGQDSAIRISEPDVRIDGVTWCSDVESSFANAAGAQLVGPVICTGFDW